MLCCISTDLVAIHTSSVENMHSDSDFLSSLPIFCRFCGRNRCHHAVSDFWSFWNVAVVLMLMLYIFLVSYRLVWDYPLQYIVTLRRHQTRKDFWHSQSCNIRSLGKFLPSNGCSFDDFILYPNRYPPKDTFDSSHCCGHTSPERPSCRIKKPLVTFLLTLGWGMDMSLTAVTRPYFLCLQFGPWATFSDFAFDFWPQEKYDARTSSLGFGSFVEITPVMLDFQKPPTSGFRVCPKPPCGTPSQPTWGGQIVGQFWGSGAF